MRTKSQLITVLVMIPLSGSFLFWVIRKVPAHGPEAQLYTTHVIQKPISCFGISSGLPLRGGATPRSNFDVMFLELKVRLLSRSRSIPCRQGGIVFSPRKAWHVKHKRYPGVSRTLSSRVEHWLIPTSDGTKDRLERPVYQNGVQLILLH